MAGKPTGDAKRPLMLSELLRRRILWYRTFRDNRSGWPNAHAYAMPLPDFMGTFSRLAYEE